MMFNSMQYLFFFPIVVLLYFIIPKKIRYIWLLAVSFYFYMCWNAKYAILLFISIFITWSAGLCIRIVKTEFGLGKVAKGILFFSIAGNLSILFGFKYLSFIIENTNFLLEKLKLQPFVLEFNWILPVGISFYIFQAIGYVIDVYREKVPVEKNFLRYALFISFFPQLVAGPIERTENMMAQLRNGSCFDIRRIRKGMVLILWGLYLKLVLADNLGTVVTAVYENYENYAGIHIVLATMMFAIQIYCDFCGYSNIAIGSAEILGYRLMENFKSPYLACSISDFWKRWHVSLTSWFTDYVYIPLGGNRKGTVRTNINTMIVFGLSGAWHGASWTYIIWGVLNGVLMVTDKFTVELRKKLRNSMQISIGGGYKLLTRIITFILINFTWLFFRARTINDAIGMLKVICTGFGWRHLLTESIYFQMQSHVTVVLLLSILLLFMVDILKDKGIDMRKHILEQGFFVRYLLYIILIGVIIVFGKYGDAYAQTQFIYFQF